MAALRAAIVQHRDTFVTEADMVNLALNGVNAIRIPVGYWLLDGTQACAFCSHVSMFNRVPCCLFRLDWVGDTTARRRLCPEERAKAGSRLPPDVIPTDLLSP